MFRHRDVEQLRELLESTPGRRRLVCTESIFSMDGDRAPLSQLAQLCREAGAALMVDEAHAFGLIGDHGAGLCEKLNLSDSVDLRVGTFGKACGRTEAACALLSLLADAGLEPAPFKPYESGCGNLARPLDALALRRAARCRDALESVCPHRFRAPLAPGVAARRLGKNPSFGKTLHAFHSFGTRPIVAEGAGWVHVPIDSRRDVIDLIVALKLPVLLVARSGLGTLNHVALSIEALRARGVPIVAALLSRGRKRDLSELDNATIIAEKNGVKVLGRWRSKQIDQSAAMLFARHYVPSF